MLKAKQRLFLVTEEISGTSEHVLHMKTQKQIPLPTNKYSKFILYSLNCICVQSHTYIQCKLNTETD